MAAATLAGVPGRRDTDDSAVPGRLYGTDAMEPAELVIALGWSPYGPALRASFRAGAEPAVCSSR